MSNPLKCPKIILRLIKGSPLTPEEGDGNFKALRDFGNQLASLLSTALNTDGTLKNNEVAKSFMPFFMKFLPPLGSARWSPIVEADAIINPTHGAVWLEANGQEVLKTDYPKLYNYYAALGILPFTLASADPLKFKVPDVSGRFFLGRKATTVNQKTLTTLTRSGSIATATKVDHGFSAGQTVVIDGAGQTEYNSSFLILTSTDSSFTFAITETAATPATGTIVATAQSDGFSVGEKGGESEHKLVESELPRISPPVTIPSKSMTGFRDGTALFSLGPDNADYADKDFKITTTFGGDSPHNNMPPYVTGVCYVCAGFKIDGDWVEPVTSL